MTTFTTQDRIHAEKDGSLTIGCRPPCSQQEYNEMRKLIKNQTDKIAMVTEECIALRKQLIAACNELMEIKR
jgi:hypothetical protein